MVLFLGLKCRSIGLIRIHLTMARERYLVWDLPYSLCAIAVKCKLAGGSFMQPQIFYFMDGQL